jgi:hypothetical protein
MKALTESFAEETSFECDPSLEEIFRNPRLVTVVSHAAPLSWIPVMGFLGVQYNNHGGADRIPTAVADRWFYSNPFTQKIASFITQSDKPRSFDELVSDFIKQEKQDIVLMPEGANAFFGKVEEIREFRSAKFIELAVRAQAPLLVVVHKGSEGWSTQIPVPAMIGNLIAPYAKFFGQKLKEEQSINLLLPPRKMKKFSMKCGLYIPKLYESDLAGSEFERRSQLEQEAAQVRNYMSDLLAQIE